MLRENCNHKGWVVVDRNSVAPLNSSAVVTISRRSSNRSEHHPIQSLQMRKLQGRFRGSHHSITSSSQPHSLQIQGSRRDNLKRNSLFPLSSLFCIVSIHRKHRSYQKTSLPRITVKAKNEYRARTIRLRVFSIKTYLPRT